MVRLEELKQTSPERFTLIFSDGSELKATLNIVTDRYLHLGMELDEDTYAALKANARIHYARLAPYA